MVIAKNVLLIFSVLFLIISMQIPACIQKYYHIATTISTPLAAHRRHINRNRSLVPTLCQRALSAKRLKKHPESFDSGCYLVAEGGFEPPTDRLCAAESNSNLPTRWTLSPVFDPHKADLSLSYRENGFCKGCLRSNNPPPRLIVARGCFLPNYQLHRPSSHAEFSC